MTLTTELAAFNLFDLLTYKLGFGNIPNNIVLNYIDLSKASDAFRAYNELLLSERHYIRIRMRIILFRINQYK